jgi:hypothetical protein
LTDIGHAAVQVPHNSCCINKPHDLQLDERLDSRQSASKQLRKWHQGRTQQQLRVTVPHVELEVLKRLNLEYKQQRSSIVKLTIGERTSTVVTLSRKKHSSGSEDGNVKDACAIDQRNRLTNKQFKKQ